MTLDQLRPGECADVDQVNGEGAFRRRLLELGLLPGTRVERTGQAPLGDPLSFKVRGAVLCLRRDDARAIGIRPEGLREVVASQAADPDRSSASGLQDLRAAK